MLICFLIPSYVLYIAVYGWWLYCKLVFDQDELFEHSDMLVYFWLFLAVYLHLSSIRTINTRYGYSKTTFSDKNKYIQAMVYASLMPVIFFDWECARNFSLFLAVTFKKFWPILAIAKICAVTSVWVVIATHMDYLDHWQYYGWLGFSISMTVLLLVKFVWMLHLYVWLFYLAPFLLYWVLYLLMWPFLKCCACARKCMGLNKKRKDEDDISVSEEGKADVVSSEPPQNSIPIQESSDYEGGDEEDPDGALHTDRSMNLRESQRRSEKYRIEEDRIETEGNLNNRKSISKRESSKEEDEKDQKDKKKKSNKKDKKKRKIFNSPIEDLWYFARVWRALMSKYCHTCDMHLKN